MPRRRSPSTSGPQCAVGPCGDGTYPFNIYCNPAANGLGNWGYSASPDHGNSMNASDIRGMFNRLGVKIHMAAVTDGLSNTILIGESLPLQHDHLAGNNWATFNGGNAHCSTIVPINYESKSTGDRCSDNPLHNRGNWNVSWMYGLPVIFT